MCAIAIECLVHYNVGIFLDAVLNRAHCCQNQEWCSMHFVNAPVQVDSSLLINVYVDLFTCSLLSHMHNVDGFYAVHVHTCTFKPTVPVPG